MSDFFSSFSGSFPLSKTLRFSLLPQGATLSKMQEQGILQRDNQRDKDYQAIKPLFDTLHDKFITQSLEKSAIDWSDFFIFYEAYKPKIRKDSALSDKEKADLKAEFSSILASLRKEVVALYEKTASQWQEQYPILKEKGYKILTESAILEVLEKEYEDDEEKQKVIKNFKGFFTYFTGFNQNRENYYSAEEKSTAVAHRIVDENLIFFCENLLLKDKLSVLDLSDEEKKVFDISFYNQCLTQEGIDTYNQLIGWTKNEKGERTSKGINQKINENNQHLPHWEKKLPQLKFLYKCIGSKKAKTIPFELIENDEELKHIINKTIETCDEYLPQIIQIITNALNNEEDLAKIWVSKNNLSRLSNRYLKNRYAFNEKWVELKIFKENKKGDEKINIPEYVSLSELKQILEAIVYVNQDSIEKEKKNYFFKSHLEEERRGWNPDREINNRFFLISLISYDLNHYYDKPRHETKDKDGNITTEQNYTQEKERIQNFLDKDLKNSVKNLWDQALFLFRFLKVFKVQADKIPGELSDLYNEINRIIAEFPLSKYYDAIRNYLTKKPFSQDKMKLNFEYSDFFISNSRWKYALIFKEWKKYSLWIVVNNSKARKIFELWEDSIEELWEGFSQLRYRQIKFQTIAGRWYIRDFGVKYSEDPDAIEHLKILIKKQYLSKYPELQLIVDTEITTKKEFDKLVMNTMSDCYKIEFITVKKEKILEEVEKWNIYLFEIQSKDFQDKANGKKDLQTIYRKSIFEQWSNIKLNSQAQIFFRKASLEYKETEGEIITQKHHHKIENEKAIKSWRYTRDTFLFHCPITLHFGTKAEGKFNQRMNQHFLSHLDEMHIIGVDRGEKHLNFYSVIDMQGNIVEQGTLNTVNGVDYEKLLAQKADDRLSARQNRDTIGSIKELKDWYISQVVHTLTQLVLKYNAIIVLEDLNGGFKRGRQKIEKSVYQKLELALAKKLGYLVLKDTSLWEPGSATNAYQLCPLVSNFGDIKGKQRWILLYTRANYTSTTDPISGWRKNLYLKKGKGEEMRKQILNFTAIGYDQSKSAFYFDYNPWKFWEGRGLAKDWRIRSNVERRRGAKDDHGQWIQKKVEDITEKLKTLFESNGIKISGDILAQIKEKADLSANFYQDLIWLIDVIMQIRNTSVEKVEIDWKKVEVENDFILSPMEVEGKKFDSREWYKLTDKELPNTVRKPTSWDANGAYNIARKGAMMLKRIVESPEKPNLFVSDEEWDEFSVSRNSK